jgi:hypothetical protein
MTREMNRYWVYVTFSTDDHVLDLYHLLLFLVYVINRVVCIRTYRDRNVIQFSKKNMKYPNPSANPYFKLFLLQASTPILNTLQL